MLIEPTLVARGLSKLYRRRTWALRDVSLELSRGEIVALVGPNGAGKTTLMRIWVGFERATHGYAQVLGRNPWHARAATTAHVGYIPQRPALYGSLTARDHLDLARHLRPTFDHVGAIRRLDRLRIPSSVRAAELSGGQQAQLGLLLALGTRAAILLLDEPLASLDPLARREFLGVLLETAEELSATTVISSHLVSDVAELADRVVVIANGQIQLDDTVPRVLRRHFLAPDGGTEGTASRRIGSFAELRGSRTTLIELPDGVTPPPGVKAATLDDVVMGYLAREDLRRRS